MVEYILRLPASVPAGKVLVHNQVRWSQGARPSRSGFRAWLDEPRPLSWGVPLRLGTALEQTLPREARLRRATVIPLQRGFLFTQRGCRRRWPTTPG